MLTVFETGLLGASDQDHLRKAQEEGRVIFTQDEDLLRLVASVGAHPGAPLAPHTPASREKRLHPPQAASHPTRAGCEQGPEKRRPPFTACPCPSRSGAQAEREYPIAPASVPDKACRLFLVNLKNAYRREKVVDKQSFLYYSVVIMATLKQKRNSELLRPVSKKTLAEEVAIILKRFILTEKLKEGDKLPPERELATTLGVSHRVVREALSILAGQGIIGKKHGRGAFVRAFDANRLQAAQAALLPSLDVAEFYKLRRAIEVGAICLAVERATEEDLAELQEILEVMKPKSEREESITADEMRFHLTLLRATHEEIFYQLDYLIVEAIRLKVYDKPRRLYRNERNPSTMMEHQAIIDALRRRDGKRAVYEMHKHFDSMMRTTGFVEKPNRNLGNGRRSPSGNPES